MHAAQMHHPCADRDMSELRDIGAAKRVDGHKLLTIMHFLVWLSVPRTGQHGPVDADLEGIMTLLLLSRTRLLRA